jgi:DNA-3-methyladenine glycosylase II
MSRAAVRHLKRADPTLRRVIERVGPYRPRPQSEGEHLDHLIRAIVYQQLAGAAAATIHGRLLALYGNRAPTPAQLLATRPARLRRAGLSPQKLGYLKDLARKVASGAVPLDTLPERDDTAVIEALTEIKGVGTWTAQMFLMFRLGRLDVLPVLDLGIQKAMRHAYGLRGMPSPARMEKIAAPWRPYRTVACWYLWRSLEFPPP